MKAKKDIKTTVPFTQDKVNTVPEFYNKGQEASNYNNYLNAGQMTNMANMPHYNTNLNRM